jgi:hypothetical protein
MSHASGSQTGSVRSAFGLSHPLGANRSDGSIKPGATIQSWQVTSPLRFRNAYHQAFLNSIQRWAACVSGMPAGRSC